LSNLAGFTPGGLCAPVPPAENNLLLNNLIDGEDLQIQIAHKVIDELLELEGEW
jgi:hypothetical protein